MQQQQSKPKFNPLFERILVTPDEKQTKSSTGLLLPSESQEVPNTATIVSVGHSILQDDVLKNVLKKGVKIMYLKHAGLPIVIDGQKIHMLTANDILGFWEE